MFSGMYDKRTAVSLIPNPTRVTADDIRKLFDALYDYFYPVVKKAVSFKALLEKDQISHLFVSTNFYASRSQKLIQDYAALYLNAWGEMFIKTFQDPLGLSGTPELLKHVRQQIGVSVLPETTLFYLKGKLKRF